MTIPHDLHHQEHWHGVHSHLNFDGTTREAFTRYQEIFRGELVIMTGADAPTTEEQGADGVPPEMADMVIHAALTVGDDVLMARTRCRKRSGRAGHLREPPAPTVERPGGLDALMEGGEAEMPFEATFFSAGFGVFRDRFGTLSIVDTGRPTSPDGVRRPNSGVSDEPVVCQPQVRRNLADAPGTVPVANAVGRPYDLPYGDGPTTSAVHSTTTWSSSSMTWPDNWG